MYPRNAASPPRIAIGAVIQISDGAVQSSGVSVVVRVEGGSETAGGGTISYGASSSIVYYTPTQAETNYTAFVVVAYKSGCTPVCQTIITTAESTSGKVSVGASQSFDNAGQTTNLPSNVKAYGGTNGTFSGGRPEVNTTHAAGTAWNSGAISASTLATDTITAAKLSADAGTEIATAVWANGTRTLTSGTNIDGSTFTAIPWNAAWDAEVQSEVTDALVAYDGPTNAEMEARTPSPTAVANIELVYNTDFASNYNTTVDAWNVSLLYWKGDSMATAVFGSVPSHVYSIENDAITAAKIAADAGAEIAAAVWSDGSLNAAIQTAVGLGAANLDTQLNTIYTDVGSALVHLADIKGATFDGSTDSIEAIRNRGDAAWTTATGFSTLDAAGVRTAVGLSSANLDTQLSGISDKTDNLPASPAAVGSAMTLADGAITEAKISTPAEASGRPTGILGMIRRLWEGRHNKRTRDRSSGAVVIRNSADNGDLETSTQSTSGNIDSFTQGV